MARMARIALSILIVVASVGALAFAASRSAAPGAAATPKPTATGTPVPTATPLPAGYIHLRVVDDFNRTGVEEPGEHGIAGAHFRVGCEDAFVQLTTDAKGDYAGPAPRDEGGRGYECFLLERNAGWLPTSPLRLPIPSAAGLDAPVRFFVHVLGPTAMELHADVIVRGLPETNVKFSRTAPPFTGTNVGCVESFAEGIGVTLIIVGSDQRVGCPSKGNRFSVIMENQIVGTFPFEPGVTAPDELTFIAGGDSMRVAAGADSAEIDGIACAIVRPTAVVLVPPANMFYILSDEARPGCGAPGKLARFKKGGRPLDPLVPWYAGDQNGRIELTEATTRVITPPNTGSAGLLPGARAD